MGDRDRTGGRRRGPSGGADGRVHGAVGGGRAARSAADDKPRRGQVGRAPLASSAPLARRRMRHRQRIEIHFEDASTIASAPPGARAPVGRNDQSPNGTTSATRLLFSTRGDQPVAWAPSPRSPMADPSDASHLRHASVAASDLRDRVRGDIRMPCRPHDGRARQGPLLARSRLPKGSDALETLVSMNRKCYESVMRPDLARQVSACGDTGHLPARVAGGPPGGRS